MKKLLVLGASIAQIPFVKTAKRLGCLVGIVDYNEKAAAIEFADEYFPCSLTDVEGVAKIAEAFNPDGITCGASDVAVLTAAEICKRRGLPGLPPETAWKVKDKGAMIKAFRQYGVPHPEYQVVTSPDDEIGIAFPLITKPVDNCGSRGINVARNAQELKSALEDSFSCSHSSRVIVEEYMDGPEVSVEILVQDGEPHVLQVTDKLTTGEPHFIEIGHSQPSQLPPADVEAIRKVAYDAAKAVGIENGCGHAEMKLTNNGPKMIEIAGRLGGDFITTVLLPITTGVDLSEYEILRALGTPKTFVGQKATNRGAAVRFVEAQCGEIDAIQIDFDAESVFGIEGLQILCKAGNVYSSVKSNSDRFGYVITTGCDAKEAVERCNRVLRCIKIDMKEKG